MFGGGGSGRGEERVTCVRLRWRHRGFDAWGSEVRLGEVLGGKWTFACWWNTIANVNLKGAANVMSWPYLDEVCAL